MFRVIGQISISGSKASIDRCSSTTPIVDGVITQSGLKRKTPDIDSWHYASPWYRFHCNTIDDEIKDFANANAKLHDILLPRDFGITYAFLTICPVGQSSDESLSCVFSLETLQAILYLGVGLQIAPAELMPEVPYWKSNLTCFPHKT